MSANPIYVAIDTSDLAAAGALARAVVPHVGGLKLGLQFFMAHGPDGVRRMQGYGLPIFLDIKLHDIGNTVAGAMASLAPLKVAIVNLHATIGLKAMQAARAAIDPATAIIAVTVLTSFDDADLSAIGTSARVTDQVTRLTGMAHASGLQGIVCSGAEVAQRRAAWPEAIIAVPGLRPDGGERGDQKRVMTPRAARDAGASILVVGRPITDAADPAAAAAAIAATL